MKLFSENQEIDVKTSLYILKILHHFNKNYILSRTEYPIGIKLIFSDTDNKIRFFEGKNDLKENVVFFPKELLPTMKENITIIISVFYQNQEVSNIEDIEIIKK